VALEEDLCNVSLFQEFGTFLCEFAFKRKNGELLLHAINYFGSAKEFVFERFPNNQIWNIKIGENKNWYSNIRKGIEKNISNICIREGIPICENSVPIGRTVLIQCAIELLKRKFTKIVRKQGYWIVQIGKFGIVKYYSLLMK
jgi:hypothetical protein